RRFHSPFADVCAEANVCQRPPLQTSRLIGTRARLPVRPRSLPLKVTWLPAAARDGAARLVRASTRRVTFAVALPARSVTLSEPSVRGTSIENVPSSADVACGIVGAARPAAFQLAVADTAAPATGRPEESSARPVMRSTAFDDHGV